MPNLPPLGPPPDDGDGWFVFYDFATMTRWWERMAC